MGSPSVNFEGPQAILRAISPRARLILTPGNDPQIVCEFCFQKYGEGTTKNNDLRKSLQQMEYF